MCDRAIPAQQLRRHRFPSETDFQRIFQGATTRISWCDKPTGKLLPQTSSLEETTWSAGNTGRLEVQLMLRLESLESFSQPETNSSLVCGKSWAYRFSPGLRWRGGRHEMALCTNREALAVLTFVSEHFAFKNPNVGYGHLLSAPWNTKKRHCNVEPIKCNCHIYYIMTNCKKTNIIPQYDTLTERLWLYWPLWVAGSNRLALLYTFAVFGLPDQINMWDESKEFRKCFVFVGSYLCLH